MKKFKRYTFGIIFPIVAIIVILLLSINFFNKTTELETLEIKNYEGKDLSSIYDFRENSVKGPQYIDINDYNLTLIPERGFPFQLVAEDKWGYKWIKWITEIEFSNDLNYKGYWESRGYSDTGNLNESFLK